MNRRTLSSSGSLAANDVEKRVRCNTDQFHLLEEALYFRSVGRRRLWAWVSELARELEMTQSNEFRLLQTLTRLNYVRREKDRT